MTVSNLVAEVSESRARFLGDNIEFVSAKLGNKIFDEHLRIFAHRKDAVKRRLCAASIPPEKALRPNGGVSKNHYRKQWLRSLQKKEGSVAALAEKIGTDPNYISSLLGPNSRRNVGDELARRVEKTYRLPSGVLDLPSEMAQKFIKAIEGLDDRDIAEVMEFIRFRKSTKN